MTRRAAQLKQNDAVPQSVKSQATTELAAGVSIDEIRQKTQASFTVRRAPA